MCFHTNPQAQPTRQVYQKSPLSAKIQVTKDSEHDSKSTAWGIFTYNGKTSRKTITNL